MIYFCQTPDIGQRLGVDFIFTSDNNHNVNKTWSLVSNSNLSETSVPRSLESLKFRRSVLSLIKFFSLKFILGQKNFDSEKNLVPKKKICVQKKILCQKDFLDQKNFGPEKNSGSKKLLVPNLINFWVWKNVWVQKKFCFKEKFG